MTLTSCSHTVGNRTRFCISSLIGAHGVTYSKLDEVREHMSHWSSSYLVCHGIFSLAAIQKSAD